MIIDPSGLPKQTVYDGAQVTVTGGLGGSDRTTEGIRNRRDRQTRTRPLSGNE